MVRMEEARTLPLGALWREYLRREGVTEDYFAEVRAYEAKILSERNECLTAK